MLIYNPAVAYSIPRPRISETSASQNSNHRTQHRHNHHIAPVYTSLQRATSRHVIREVPSFNRDQWQSSYPPGYSLPHREQIIYVNSNSNSNSKHNNIVNNLRNNNNIGKHKKELPASLISSNLNLPQIEKENFLKEKSSLPGIVQPQRLARKNIYYSNQRSSSSKAQATLLQSQFENSIVELEPSSSTTSSSVLHSSSVTPKTIKTSESKTVSPVTSKPTEMDQPDSEDTGRGRREASYWNTKTCYTPIDDPTIGDIDLLKSINKTLMLAISRTNDVKEAFVSIIFLYFQFLVIKT